MISQTSSESDHCVIWHDFPCKTMSPLTTLIPSTLCCNSSMTKVFITQLNKISRFAMQVGGGGWVLKREYIFACRPLPYFLCDILRSLCSAHMTNAFLEVGPVQPLVVMVITVLLHTHVHKHELGLPNRIPINGDLSSPLLSMVIRYHKNHYHIHALFYRSLTIPIKIHIIPGC